MRGKLAISTAAVVPLLAAISAGTAWAQAAQQVTVTERTPSYVKTPVPAPSNALEIGVNSGNCITAGSHVLKNIVV